MVDVDETPRTFGTDQPLSRSEIHTVSAVAENAGVGTQRLAGLLGITPGGASQMVSRLVRRGLLRKERGGRKVSIFVTPDGECAHREHLAFHRRMRDHLMAGQPDARLREQDLQVIQRLLESVRSFRRQEG